MPGGVGGLGREPHPTRLSNDFNPGIRKLNQTQSSIGTIHVVREDLSNNHMHRSYGTPTYSLSCPMD